MTEVLQEGKRDGMMPPKFLLEKVVGQIDSIAEPVDTQASSAPRRRSFPASVPAADQKRLHHAMVNAVDDQVCPAYTRFADYIANEYAPYGRTEPGIWSLPDGDALYGFEVKQQTTTSMDPEPIHELGLKEVERIDVDMPAIATQHGFTDLKTFHATVRAILS